ncbi:Acetylcholine receptor subunit alpha-type unc-38 [Aphelenchoides bicaudatus]|nr:Acetylcholine receptor subunit alpha-type unc-38 [Aphelenchoides bicaudatus]
MICGTLFCILVFLLIFQRASSTQDSNRLFDDLMLNYNSHQRAGGPDQQTTVHVRQLSLSQIIDLDEINQIVMCSVWLRQTWIDPKLAWDPVEYGGVDVLHVPHEIIWVPDIILFNAESSYNITISTKATVYFNGRVVWEPPSVVRSVCQIQTEWFPLDEQFCEIKIGSWTYPHDLLNLELIDNNGIVIYDQDAENLTDNQETPRPNFKERTVISWNSMDISDYYPSVEWDIMSLKTYKQLKDYGYCCGRNGPFVELTFELGLRRITFFYILNLLVPCISMQFLSLLVFYLPSESGEKIQLSISILVSVTFFFLLLTEMLPASGHAMPLIAKYLLFTMLVVSGIVVVAVFVLNLHFRKQTTHKMGKFTRHLLLHRLPQLLKMRPHKVYGRPSSHQKNDDEDEEEPKVRIQIHRAEVAPTGRRRPSANTLTRIGLSRELCKDLARAPVDGRLRHLYYSPTIMKKQKADSEIEEDWEYAAAVVDRLFLWIFAVLCIGGTIWIFGQAPIFYDSRSTFMQTNANQFIESFEEIVKRIRV